MNTTTTRGPWAFDKRYADNSGAILGADGKSVAAIAASVRRPDAEKLANARLLAAAPDLLEALQLAHDYLAGNGWDNDPRMLPIRAALNRATSA